MDPNETPDDTQDSSPAPGDTEAAPTSKTGDKPAGSMLDAIATSLKEKGLKPSEAPTEKAEDEEDETQGEAEDPSAKPEGETEDEESEEDAGQDPEKSSEPEEKTDEKKEGEETKPSTDPLDALSTKFAKNPGVQNLIQQYRAAKPKAEGYDTLQSFITSNRMSQETFQKTISLAAMLIPGGPLYNPEQALKQLEPIVGQLKNILGQADALPEDLAQAVKEGSITDAYAKELVKARAKATMAESGRQMTEAQQRQYAFDTAMDGWIRSKMKTDLTFKTKVNGDPDGLKELVEHKFAHECERDPSQVSTPTKAVALADRCYTELKRTFTTRLTPKPKPVKGPLRTRSGGTPNSRKEPESVAEAVALAYANSR